MALALHRTVGELKATISEAEFRAWLEYFSLEPTAADRAELQLAVLSSMLASFSGGKASYKDFLISQQEDPQEAHEETREEKNARLAAAIYANFGISKSS